MKSNVEDTTMDTIQLDELTITQIHDAYRNKSFTAKTLVSAYLQRIDAIDRADNGPRLNSIVSFNEDATSEAVTLDNFLDQNHRLIGPLHGIPVVVKDNIETAGLTTTFGSVVAKDFVPQEDATAVRKLKSAGAIILAKTSMPDWGTDWFSSSSLFGQVRNPYHLDCDPGASSSGTAAAVAANLAVIGLGTDSAGSIRLPSSFCNLVGMRPTVGLLSEKGCSPGIKGQGVIGPIGRTVTDVAKVMDVLAGFDEEDLTTSIHALTSPVRGGSYTNELGYHEKQSVRFGVVRNLFGDDRIGEEAAVNTVVNDSLSQLQRAGCEVVDIDIPTLLQCLKSTNLMLARNRPDLDAFLEPRFGTNVAEIHSSGRYPSGNAMIPHIAVQGVAHQHDLPSYGKILDSLEEFQKAVLYIILKHKLSALIYPTAKRPAPFSANINQAMRATFPTNTVVASQLRFPAISLPVGFTSAGLPVGLEIVGPPLSDQALLNLAFMVEEIAGARKAPVFNQ